MSIFNLFKSKAKETESKPEVARDTTWDGAPEWANKKLRSGLEEYWANEVQYAPVGLEHYTNKIGRDGLCGTVIAVRGLKHPAAKYALFPHEKVKEIDDKLAEMQKSINMWHVTGDATIKPKREPVHWSRETAANLAGYFDGKESELRPSQILAKFLLKHNLIDEDVKDDVEKAVRLAFRHWHKDPWKRQQIAETLKEPAIHLKGADGTKHKIEDEIRIVLNMTEKPFMTEKQAIEISSKGYIPMTVIKEHFYLVEG